MSMMVSMLSLKELVITWSNIYQSDITNGLHILELLKFILSHGDQAILELDDFGVGIEELTFERTLSSTANTCCVDVGFEVASCGEAQIGS